MLSIDITGYVEDKSKFKVKRSDLSAATMLIIGDTYVVYPHNKFKKHRGRFVTVLSFVIDDEKTYVAIKYQDNNRRGRANFGDLITRGVYDKLEAQATAQEPIKVNCYDCKFMEHDHVTETTDNITGENWYCSKNLRKSFSDLMTECNTAKPRVCDGFKHDSF